MADFKAQSSSSPTSPEADGAYTVCCISLSRSDRITLISTPPEITDKIRAAILSSWGPIQADNLVHGVPEFKLKGNPWRGHEDEAVKSRELLCGILACMANNGWTLLQSADVSKASYMVDTLFFEPGTPDPYPVLFALSFNMTDRIRLIGPPKILEDTYPHLKDVVLGIWANSGSGIQSERNYHGSLEIKLSGNPFGRMVGSDTVPIRLLLCQVISRFHAIGYKLYGSANISLGHEGASDLESWVFRKMGPPWP